ncbi:ATP-binding protein [Mucilaginibacter sp.]|uniref:ATP-binding protein n=1 Tax=Mucilaginibacter sp. TaxID=1882438 RepID=UPI0035BC901A
MNDSPSLLNDKQLIDVLCMTQYPTAVHVSEDAVIQAANDAMLNTWGKDRSVIGKTLTDALPELKGQPFIDLFKRVWNEGITVSGTDTPANIIVDGRLQTFYFDYEYRAIKNSDGKTFAILHTAIDITNRYLSKKREQELVEELTATNEELTASNEEARASNEELATINEELLAATEELRLSQEYLQSLNEELSISEGRFRNLIRQAPMGICLISAGDLAIIEVNDAYLNLVGKQRHELENRTIWDAVPEAAEAYAPVMNDVIDTGVPYVANEHELYLIRNGVPERVFINFVYEPVRAQDGTVNAIMVIGIEVTELVASRRKMEVAEQRSRLAVDAAGIGIFDLDLKTNIPLVSGRFNEIFNLDKAPGKFTIDAITHPEDRSKRNAAHEQAIKTGDLFYEARVIHKDQSVRWIRAQGKVFYDDNQNPEKMLGTVLDITDHKALQQQKDDFISIASHELKTPITSLKASLQLMDRIKDKPGQTMIPKLIMQSRKSIERVSYLVEDLLNVSRLQQTEIHLNKNTFILSQLVNAVANPISIIAKHQIAITGQLELEVYADEHRIDQVLTNFLSNAVKYAPESDLITVDISSNADMVTVSVTDQGQGIPQEKLGHLFDRYYRVDPSGHQGSGLGLGLYICSEIIKRHNGDIGVKSEEGLGSTFWFTLPLAK